MLSKLLAIIAICATAAVSGCKDPPNSGNAEKSASATHVNAERPPAVVSRELPAELAGFRAAIENSKLDYIRVKARAGQSVAPWGSKFRGVPYIPNGSAYPRDPAGKLLVLLAQLNFGEMPRLDGYPASGLLQFFVSDGLSKEHVWGSVQYDEKPFNPDRYFSSLQDQRFFRVIFHSDVLTDNVHLQAPPAFSSEPMLPIMQEAALTFEKHTEPVLIDDYRFTNVFAREPQAFFAQFGTQETAVANGYIAFSRQWSLAKVGGYASFVQRDPRSIKPTEDWLLLLEIQSSNEAGVDILWGDAGVGGLFIRRDDLKKLDFSKVAYYWDNH